MWKVDLSMSVILCVFSRNFNNYFQYGLALLALCESGAPIRTRYIREILDGQSEDGNYRYGIGKCGGILNEQVVWNPGRHLTSNE